MLVGLFGRQIVLLASSSRDAGRSAVGEMQASR